MKYTVYTLFPALLEPWTREALLGKAASAGLIEFRIRDLRRHANDKHNRVDDTPYGGGAGMVIRVDVAARAVAEAMAEAEPPDEVILLTPAGEPFNQATAEKLAANSRHLCMLAGRYEGFDARTESLVTRELSIGDYVLMGGELAALTVIEATARLVPGVLGAADSAAQESYATGLLDYPEFTRPLEFAGTRVPDVLLSGHHGEVARWRRRQALLRTWLRRRDLLERADLDDQDREFLLRLEDAECAPDTDS